MKILSVPNPILSTQAMPVMTIDNKIRKLIRDMIQTLIIQKNPEGVGLAAPQVGVPLRFFVIKPGKKASVAVFINPEVIDNDTRYTIHDISDKKHETGGKDDEAKLEGCLSIPRIWGQVVRNEVIEIRYQMLDGKLVEKKITGFEAVIIQHELDHLEGILFTQRVLEQKGKLYKEVKGELKRYEI